jgi:hypothetical protein
VTPRGATGSGAATSGGITFQHRVAAYYAALILAGEVRMPGLGTDALGEQVWLETEEPIDDIKVVDVLGGTLLIQAKRTLDAGRGPSTEFAKVCDQLVRGHHDCAPETRFAVMVGRDTARSIAKDLRAVLRRAREQPASATPRHLAPSKSERKHYDGFVAHLQRSARAHKYTMGAAELRAILRRTELRVLDVEPDGMHEHFAVRALERDVVLDPAQARAGWSALLEVCGELARARSYTDRVGLQEALRARGIVLREPPDLRPDIAALRSRSAEALRLLRSRSAIRTPGEDEIKIERRASEALASRVREGSIAVVGDAGSGKTACTYEALERLRGDGVEVVVIAAELLEAHTEVALERELRINRPLHELLRYWPAERGVLVIDGLDAARDEATRATLVRLIEQVAGAGGRFTVLASLRTFDLRNSLRLARILPADSADEDQFHRAEFAGTAHFWIPALTEDEVGQLAARAPALHAVLQAATPALRELGALPFNLDLLGELVLGAGLGAERLEHVDTQLALLDAYWRERVRGQRDGDDREHVLRRACEAMVAARRLYADRRELQGPSNEVLVDLLHDNVLVEDWAQGRETVAFAHNLLHDYAVARTVFRIPDNELLDRLNAEPGLLLSARPSLELHFRWLWEEDSTRKMFWAAALKTGGPQGLRPIGKTIAPAVVVALAQSEEDLAQLLDALTDADADRAGAAEDVLRQVVSAAMTVPADEIALRGMTWPGAALRVATSLRPTLAHGVKILIHHQLDAPPARASRELGEAARRLLRYAWDAPERDGFLVRAAIQAVLRTFATDAVASEALLRDALEPQHLAEYGYEELPALLMDASQLVHAAPAFLTDCYRAAFEHEEESDEPTQMYASRIMPLTSNRRQDYEHARWVLGEALPEFLQHAPEAATEAVVAMAAAYATHRGTALTAAPLAIRWRSRTYRVYADASYIWDSGGAHDIAEQALATFDHELEERAKSNPASLSAIFDTLAAGPIPASVLAHVFRAAARSPQTFPQELAELLTKPSVLAAIDLQFPAGQYLGAVFPGLPSSLRTRIESALRRLPAQWPADRHEIGERVRDTFVGVLDAATIVTPTVRRLHAALMAEGPPELRPPFRIETGWTGRTSSLAEDMAERGADVQREANRALLEAVEPLKEFADRHLNSIPSRSEIRSITPVLRRIVRALARNAHTGAERTIIDLARMKVAEVAERLSRVPGILTVPQGRLVSEVLVAASQGPAASSSRRSDEVTSWSPTPRISAAQGLPHLAAEPRFLSSDLLAAIERLAQDRAPEVRFHIAWRLGALTTTAPDAAWRLAEEFAKDEPSPSVLERLANALVTFARVDTDRALAVAEGVLRRERRRRSPRRGVLDNFVGLLVTHHIWEGSDPGADVAKQFASEASGAPESAGQLMHAMRDALFHGPVADDNPSYAAVRRRALDVLRLYLTASTSGIAQLRDRHEGRLGSAWPDDELEELRGWLRVAGAVADQLYFSSGVFQAGQPSSNDRHADLPQRERLYHEGHDLLTGLAGIGEPHATHHLIEMLEGCIGFDPPGAFLLVAEAVRSTAEWGYQFESMGQELVIRIVKRYVTDYRDLFRDDPELEAGLTDILDIFVDAGWPEARRLVYGLAEIFR